MSIRDPFYVEIEAALGRGQLDTDLFERLAAELVESKGLPTNLTVGGADNGYDFELVDSACEPGPGVVTTSDRVTTNLIRNLDRNKANCPLAAKKTYVVTSSVLTSKKRDNLKKASRERGFVYLGASDRHELARYIYTNPHWARELLGLSGQPSALSAVPVTSRPLMDVPLVGRQEAAERLRTLERDALLIGSPGSGKTALLSGLAVEGNASFMVSADMAAVANAIRQQAPLVVIIDDLEDAVAAVRRLAHLRAEIGAEFRITVTDWERNSEVEQALGLSDADIIELERLTRDDIVAVVESVGISGPRFVVREIVNQSEGVPGLAVTLTQAALAGDYDDLFDGNRLGALMESAVNRLLGSPREGEQAALALGAIALAGDPGLTLEEVADYVRISTASLQSTLRRLTSGGIIRSRRGRVSLRPPALRRYMIRKAFFGASPADYAPLLGVVPDPGAMACELVLAARAGAAVPRLLDLVIASGSMLAARYFAGSGEREARELLAAAPALAISVAREALQTAPQVVIPLLLDLAVDDTRELHSTPEHPLRLILDWSNGALPGRGEAVPRKRVVVGSALKWAAEGGDFNTACRACAGVLRTVFEGTETDPGAGMTVTITRGLLTDTEVEELREVWGEIRDAIEKSGEASWPSLLAACRDLIHPQVFGGHPDEGTFERSRRLGEAVVADLGGLAVAHPGVLDHLNTMRRHLGHHQLYPISEDYAALFGDDQGLDWRRHQEEQTRLITGLAETWVTGDPDEFAARIRWLQREAALAGINMYDRSPFLCHLIAQKVDDPERWLSALATGGAAPACLLPFLEKAVQKDAAAWELTTLPILDDPSLESAAVEVALRAARLSEDMWSMLSPRLPRYFRLVETLCLRNQVPEPTLRRLLTHDSAVVAHAAAVGMWTGEAHGDVPPGLRPEWEDAVARIDDDEYWLQEILASSNEMAARWLRTRIENNDWLALSNSKNVESACRSLTRDQRLDLLRSVPRRFHEEAVVASLVGDSDELYREVLRDHELGERWQDPLRRRADDTWRRRAGIALEEGKTSSEVARASMPGSESWTGPYSEHLQGQIDEYSAWLNDPVAGVREVARQAIDSLSKRKERALAEERLEAIEGLG